MSKPLKVIAGAPDRPLVIGDIEIPCYVLEGETRVLSQRGMFHGFGAKRGGKVGGAEIPRIMASKTISPFVSKELAAALTSPIEFQPPGGGRTAYGYPARLIIDICNVYIKAWEANALLPSQQHLARNAAMLVRGLAGLAIDALVDEATGYQDVREERALAVILEKFIAKELQPWTKTFPYEFYMEICRLKGWPSIYAIKRPSVIGRYTNDIVYERLAPGVLDELKARTPRLPSGNLKNKLFEWFTPNIGHPKLREHLVGVMALMRAAPTFGWEYFQRSLQRAYPKLNETIPMALDD